jgi:hypothetical protein
MIFIVILVILLLVDYLLNVVTSMDLLLVHVCQLILVLLQTVVLNAQSTPSVLAIRLAFKKNVAIHA